MHPLQSLQNTGTKLYLDSVDPAEISRNLEWGAVGATSNPAIISELIARGTYDTEITARIHEGIDDAAIAWGLTNQLVEAAEERFRPIWDATQENAGWVSFELDPLLESTTSNLSLEQRRDAYIELGKAWAKNHSNRMIKVPATPAGISALEELAANGIALNVTLIFTEDQYALARDAVWRGAQRLGNTNHFKSVYSVFVSRIDIYTQDAVPTLSDATQGLVGILNAQRIWEANNRFWAAHPTRLQQEIIFASTGTKKPSDPPWKYVAALAGDGIQTNPPSTNAAVMDSDLTFERTVDRFPPESVIREIDEKVDFVEMHSVLMREGIEKFIKPQLALLGLIAQKHPKIEQ